MKISKKSTREISKKTPKIRFKKNQNMTSFAGMVVFHVLFQLIGIEEKLAQCFSHLMDHKIYGHCIVFHLLVVHCLLGYRCLRDVDSYRSDPLVGKLLGLSRLPDISTISRTLKTADEKSVENVQHCMQDMVIERLLLENIARLTLDFDGSVQSTKGHAEGTEVGFNKKKKGARSYYPLYCTIAQISQFFDFHHRKGNVHDSNGAAQFMKKCLEKVRKALPTVILEVRIDSAFYNEEIFSVLSSLNIEFSCSVPYKRFEDLKKIIDENQDWKRINQGTSYFEQQWKPEAWRREYRLIFVRKRHQIRHKGPVQLDLFESVDHQDEYKVIATNKTQTASSVIQFHNGRGSQEKIFGESNQNTGLNRVWCRHLISNKFCTLAGMFAHNITRELQMRSTPIERQTLPKRPARWKFLSLGTIRRYFLHIPGRITHPHGQLTLTIGDDSKVKKTLCCLLEGLGFEHHI